MQCGQKPDNDRKDGRQNNDRVIAPNSNVLRLFIENGGSEPTL